MSLLSHLAPLREAYDRLIQAGGDPFDVRFDAIASPTEGVLRGRRVLLLGTNNYLGLTFDPSCIAAATQALEQRGTGTTGSRIANGTYGGHRALEDRLARFYGRRSAMVFTTGYQANLGVLSSLVGPGDHMVIDADSHASIYDGVKLSRATVTRFRHNDPDDLARRLSRMPPTGNTLIVVEGIYSMLGDTAPLAEIAALKRRYGAYLLVDEAHSMGVLGETGRGLAEYAGVEADVDFVVGTFSKSLGAVGGFCVSNMPDFDLLRLASRPYMFTASLPPAVIASVTVALDRLQRDPGLRRLLLDNARHLHGALSRAGFVVGPEPTPIISIQLPSPELAIAFWNRLIEAGIYINLALPPATPRGLALLRSSVSAAHTREQLDRAVSAAVSIGAELGVITPRRRAVSE
ncbi:MAG: aminotransferase class I/II-fold pyridoxal phosphate-dependent enzyme [Magnetospirillum sp.]|nr:aminotransferase class I/II-fold pyridoxal phosphate-dependent enzyme [Magnetospirillum sp.]